MRDARERARIPAGLYSRDHPARLIEIKSDLT
jgi:hypothetical protein